MTDLVDRNLSVRTIRKQLEFATSEQFGTRLMRDIRTRLDHLHNAYSNFRRAHTILASQAETQEERDGHDELFDQTENEYLQASGLMQERIFQADNYQLSNVDDDEERQSEPEEQPENDVGHQRQNAQPPQQNDGQANGATSLLNCTLPQIIVHCGNKKVEKTWSDFDGNPMQWQGFHDLYKSAVHDNPALTVAEKFAQLKLSLKGKAASALGDYQLTDQNYQEAWERLKNLYQCEYTTSKELLWKFNSLPKLTHANATMIQRFSNVTHQVIRQLKAMNYPTEHYDLIFVHSLHDKLDSDTRYEWSTKRPSDRPTISEMLAFLDQRAKNLCDIKHTSDHSENDQRKRHSTNRESRNDHKRAKANTSSEQKPGTSGTANKCKVCNKESHPVHRCQKFLKMDLAGRRSAAKEHNLCYNCLSTRHTSRDCKASTCKRCDKKHNSLLCNDNPMNKAAHALQKNQVKPKSNNRASDEKKL